MEPLPMQRKKTMAGIMPAMVRLFNCHQKFSGSVIKLSCM